MLQITQNCKVFYPSQEINVKALKTISTESDAWIGLIPAHVESREENANDNHDVNYFYSNKDSWCLRGGEPGRYEIRWFPKDSQSEQIGVGIPIIINYFKVSDPWVYERGRIEITYDFTSFNGKPEPLESNAWIGLVPVSVKSRSEEENDKHDICWFYLNSEKKGENVLSAPSEGLYEVRAFSKDNGGVQIGVGIPVVVISRQ
ncbi:hypothetical protein RFI_01951 [Reticulomyxa filosa]|uniref:Uncharacterized protein n=1 Tax=Reticulomyxa filosa TaxID=46433 RepID=X6PAN3_RETFI|nr:hypothetical protein RFI_01951 [Reticulomyxa filosa]|eukprot:ETO35124.1 hypothetical protein RFI_01951 [Reticulomyxa filosa]